MRDGIITHSFYLPSQSICAGIEGQKTWRSKGSIRCNVVCELNQCSLVACTLESGGVYDHGSYFWLLTRAGTQSRCEKKGVV